MPASLGTAASRELPSVSPPLPCLSCPPAPRPAWLRGLGAAAYTCWEGAEPFAQCSPRAWVRGGVPSAERNNQSSCGAGAAWECVARSWVYHTGTHVTLLLSPISPHTVCTCVLTVHGSHAHPCTLVHSHTRSPIHTRVCTHVCPYTHPTHAHSHIPTHIHVLTNTSSHGPPPTVSHVYTRVCSEARTLPRAPSCAQTHRHSFPHVCSHIHTRSCTGVLGSPRVARPPLSAAPALRGVTVALEHWRLGSGGQRFSHLRRTVRN